MFGVELDVLLDVVEQALPHAHTVDAGRAFQKLIDPCDGGHVVPASLSSLLKSPANCIALKYCSRVDPSN